MADGIPAFVPDPQATSSSIDGARHEMRSECECLDTNAVDEVQQEESDGLDEDLLDSAAADAASPGLPIPPDGCGSWDWPLSRHEKKTRISALDRSLQLIDQQLLLQELKELREFRRCHEGL